MAKHIGRTKNVFPERANPLDKCHAPQQDIHNGGSYEVGSIGHIAGMLAQFGLPHSDPGEILHYTKEYGDFSFTVSSAVRDGGIPWGVIPRLFQACVSTQAVFTKSLVVHLDHNLGSFLRRELGMDVAGGDTGVDRDRAAL